MQTVDEAVDFFRARGFTTFARGNWGANFIARIRRPPSPPPPPVPSGAGYEADIQVLRCAQLVSRAEDWIVRVEHPLVERHFSCLADAANAVLAHLQGWLAEHPADTTS